MMHRRSNTGLETQKVQLDDFKDSPGRERKGQFSPLNFNLSENFLFVRNTQFRARYSKFWVNLKAELKF